MGEEANIFFSKGLKLISSSQFLKYLEIPIKKKKKKKREKVGSSQNGGEQKAKNIFLVSIWASKYETQKCSNFLDWLDSFKNSYLSQGAQHFLKKERVLFKGPKTGPKYSKYLLTLLGF